MVKRIIFIAAIYFGCSSVYGQEKTKIKFIQEKLETFRQEYPHEKVYLHTDRKYYAPGESIWFQSYLVAGSLHEPSPFSANVYVELYSETDSLVEKKLIFSKSGFGEGTIDIPQKLTDGNYVLRAYTNWMRNFDQSFFFEKPIVVVASEEKDSTVLITNNKIDIQFFPEGGNLVSGIPTKVGFKAINGSGKGIAVEGEVYNSTGAKITSFSTEHDGMGLFTMLPQKGEFYSVKIAGRNETYSLPKLENEGYGIQVIQRPSQLRLIFRANISNSSKIRFKALIHTRGLVSHTIEVDLSKGEALGVISTEEMPAGISHVTLFDENDRPLLERLVFIERPIEASLALDKNSYKAREKLTTIIKLTDTNGDPFSGVMSMSVLDMDKVIDGSPEQTIYSELLLNSDLKGYIDNPMYYFNTENPEAKKHLDLVMMTHGWSRFSWQKILSNDDYDLKFPVEQGFNLTGTLYEKFGKKEEADGKVTLMSGNSFPALILESSTDDQGRFVFENLMINNSDNILLKGKTEKGKDNVRFEIDSFPKKEGPKAEFKTFFGVEEVREKDKFLEQKKVRDQIERAFNPDSMYTDLGTFVVEGDKKKAEILDRIRLETTDYGRGTSAFDFTKWKPDGNSNILYAFLQGFRRVRVELRASGDRIYIGGSKTPAPTLLDGYPTDIAFISSLPPETISRAVVIENMLVGTVLAFYTRRKDGLPPSPESLLKSNNIVLDFPNTYDQPREFYAPKYDVQKPEDAKPDKRAVLHWQTMIELDENGEAIIEFYNSDDAKQIMFDVQGLTNSGIPFFINKSYTIGGKN
ncbi:hypothetical protein EV198_2773 [Roseivirga ehrenbergii]|uniref:Macroglobulin domain-containing protein n=1 Tax=Roseivirga ehrenbergii (strain DSM 102268 / JCM 13514 / KCTC 12282 / NCIMB 14502 / KMM 6017) TaxID=279360 RepID=A0A150XTZ5_ROSEK|nr:hypothetical protein [Roseivirga ehrenbergii]KYG82156.1 hypothetical protein MB14_01800 [Roseivirga ehrenbergii]TCL01981.1 hypothetical protein EV198_2773 [Roseivirga ehrenbergii]